MGRCRNIMIMLGLLALSTTAMAQIPPALDCVENAGNDDYLTLNYSGGAACDTFVVWASQSTPGGPYAPIDTVYGPGIFVDTVFSDTFTVWYFLSCLGTVSPSSDTINNREPVTPAMASASVIGNDVQITWEEGTSPETFGYIVYWFDGASVVAIDTVYGKSNVTTIHTGSDPANKSEQYFISAIDSCFNDGIISLDPHSTIWMQVVAIDSCAQTVDIAWSDYVNWAGGVNDYQVYAQVNGGAYGIVSPAGYTNTTFQLTGSNDGDTICMFINALEQGGVNQAVSNEVCVVVKLVQPAAYTHMMNVNVVTDNQIDLEWIIDSTADIKNFNILRNEDGGPFSIIGTLPAPKGLGAPLTYTDAGVSVLADDYRYAYQIEAFDNCNAMTTTSGVEAIRLEGNSVDGVNTLRWNNITYAPVPTGQITYELFRGVDGVWTFVESLPDTPNLVYVDDASQIQSLTGSYFYKVQGLYTENIFNQDRESWSNELEIDLPIKIRIPNAFKPNAVNPVNRIFRPIIVFAKLTKYKMQIFNRNGQQIFESDELLEGWNGESGGKLVPGGVYAYQITFTDDSGFDVVKTGTVMVIR